MDHPCPICKRPLTKEHKIKYIDYHCFPSMKDHHYSKRIKDDVVLMIKVRLSPAQEKLFFKVNFMEGYTEAWTKVGETDSRSRINQVFEPDFSDLDKLQAKIRTYLLFS